LKDTPHLKKMVRSEKMGRKKKEKKSFRKAKEKILQKSCKKKFKTV